MQDKKQWWLKDWRCEPRSAKTAIQTLHYVALLVKKLILHHSLYPINDAKPIFRIAEISESAVMNTMSSLKDSKAKDEYGLDTTFFISHKDALVCPHCSSD